MSIVVWTIWRFLKSNGSYARESFFPNTLLTISLTTILTSTCISMRPYQATFWMSHKIRSIHYGKVGRQGSLSPAIGPMMCSRKRLCKRQSTCCQGSRCYRTLNTHTTSASANCDIFCPGYVVSAEIVRSAKYRLSCPASDIQGWCEDAWFLFNSIVGSLQFA
jgi:hypothetical protein